MIDPAPGPLPWQTATLTAIRPVTRRVKSYRFRVAFDRPMLAGQHVDLRLTAPDGYQAQRSYSIASPPDGDGTIELLIEGLPDGDDLVAECYGSRDFRIGVEAFLAKQKPAWTGT